MLITMAAGGGRPKLSDSDRFQKPKYRSGEIVVKFRTPLGIPKDIGTVSRTSIASVDALLSRFDVSSLGPRFKHKPIPPRSGLPDLSRIYRITFPERYEPLQVARALAEDPKIEYAEPIYIDVIEEIPNDPEYDRQSHLPQIYAPEAWDIQHGDSTIVIAIVDNGTQWDHPDLLDNIWTNEAEANGLAYVDDDSNGYIDDIHGYDLAENDNDPTHPPGSSYSSHGTHTAGLAGAVTNNGLGVASISWNCEIMPVKSSFDEDPQYVDKGYQGILYAAENGADIISLSWGSFRSFSQADQDVINYAYGLGSIVVAAAGNLGISDPHFPSSYMNTMSVTWVNSQDRKAPDGAWGLGVDVSSPGVNILSTVPTDNGSYSWISGSSMACPIAAGCCALVKAQHPEWSNDQIVRQVVLTTDNIDAQNPAYTGQMGSGRVNAFRAVTETDLTEVFPRLALFSMAQHDSVNGDGDGFFERGEEINLNITLRNYAISPASDVSVTIRTADPDLTITDDTSIIPSFPPDTLNTTVDPLTFTIASDAEAHMAEIVVDFTSAEGASGTEDISVIVGRMPILLVDDDDGENNVEEFYTMLFDSLGIGYAHWDHIALGSPTGGLLSVFPIVIWMCEWAFPTLEDGDQVALGTYLDNGGNLFISGQDIGWDFYDPEGYAFGCSSWYETYLHAVYYEDDSPVQNVLGIEGDAIGDGLTFEIWQPGRVTAEQFPEEIEPTPGADAIFFYEGGQHHKAGVKYEGDHKVVYLGFGLEAIAALAGPPNPKRGWQKRMEVLKRILNWMNFITHTPLRDREGTTQSTPVTVQLAHGVTDIDSLLLIWKSENDSTYTSLSMEHMGDGFYTATLPPPGAPATISYFFSAATPYFQWQAPVGATSKEGDIYSFRIGLDETPPEIRKVDQLEDTYRKQGSALVKATVTDNIGLKFVTLYFQTNNGPVDSVEMSPTGQPDEYEGTLAWSAEIGDEVSYMIEAIDSSVNENFALSKALSFHIVHMWLVDDFESGTSKWNLGDGWDTVPMGHNSPTSMTDSPAAFYDNNEDNSLTLVEPLDLSACSTAAVTFYHWYFTQEEHDFGHVEASADSQTWSRLASYTGNQFPPMVEDTVLLNDFCGHGYDQLWIRFRMVSDGADTSDGWYLDDITLWIDSFQTEVEEERAPKVPHHFSLSQNYPNPFNAETDIRYQIPDVHSPVHVGLTIYNVLGQAIRTLVDTPLSAGHYTVKWDGRDRQGRDVSSGIYFYRLSVDGGRFRDTKRMVVLK